MNIYSIVLTDQAEKDLSGIYEYIAYTLHEKHNARKQLDRIKEAIQCLDTMSERHRRYDKGIWKKRNTHFFSVDNYTIFYTVANSTQTVSVIRIMYSRRNVDDQLLRHTDY